MVIRQVKSVEKPFLLHYIFNKPVQTTYFRRLIKQFVLRHLCVKYICNRNG